MVQHLVAGEQRVLRGRVDLDREHVVDAGGGVVQRARHRGQAAQAERVLHPGRVGCSLGQHAQPLGHGGESGQGTRGGDLRGERLTVAVERAERERGDAQAGVQQLARVRPGERGGGVRGRVGAHERERVTRLDLDPRRRGGGPLRPLAFAGERQPQLRQQGEVAGADPAEVAQHRQRPVAQDRGQGFGDLRPVTAAAGGHLGEPDQERPAHELVGQRVADAAGMAAQQPHAVGAPVGLRDRDVPVGADAGGAAVDRLAVGRGLGDGARAGDPLAGGGGELDVDRAAA